MSLADASDHTKSLVTMMCRDAAHIPDFANDGRTFDTFAINLSQAQVAKVLNKSVALLFHLTQDASKTTEVSFDNVVLYTSGEGSRVPNGQSTSVGTQRDTNEPNDSADKATSLTCNVPTAGVFGDVGADLNNSDSDWFVLNRVPIGKLVINVQADALTPSSSADAMFRLYRANTNKQLTLIGEYDDSGSSLDPQAVYTNPTANASLYVELTNWSQDDAGAFYKIKAECAQPTTPAAAQLAAAPATMAQPALTPSRNAATSQSSRKTWTVILFLNGEDTACVQNNSPESCWDKTYEQSIRGIEAFIGSKQSFLNVVVLLDGPNYGGVARDMTRYVVQPDGNYTDGVNMWSLPEINMGDPQTLADFARWAMANYPAEHYYLSIDDHGGGTSGTSWDHNDADGKKIDDNLTPAELRAAMKTITNNGNAARKIDIFAFESCLMGMFENAYDLKDYADYIALFQSISWTSTNYPEYFRDLAASDTVEAVARRIIQRYPVTSTSTPYTFSLVQSSKLEDVKVKLNNFADQLMGADLATLNSIRNQTQAFNGATNKGDASQDTEGYLDLWDFANRVQAAGIATSQATALQEAIDAAVVEKKAVPKGGDPIWDYSNYHGLSITYPSEPLMTLTPYCHDYALSDYGNGGWAKFIIKKVFGGNYDFNCGAASTEIQPQPADPPQTTPTLIGNTILEPRPQAPRQVFLPLIQR